MGKSAPSAPATPNPVTVANAQTTSNVDTAVAQNALNDVNQVTPYGNLTYQQTGSVQDDGNTVPQFTATTTLTPAQQQALNSEQNLTSGLYGLADQQLGRVDSALASPMDTSNIPQTPQNIGQLDNQGISQIYGLATSQLDPQWQRQQSELNDQLAEQGIPTGSDAYNKAQQQFSADQSQAYNGALANAISEGQQQSQNTFADTEQAQQQGLQTDAYLYNQPLNEAIALEGGGQIPNPTFSSTPQTSVAPTDVTGAYGLASQAAQNTYAAQAGQASSGNTAAAGLLGTGISGLAYLWGQGKI